MDRPRLFRLLRIALSVVCLIVCGLLIALWVRSYSLEDVISSGGPRFPRCLQIVSGKGKIKAQVYEASPPTAYWEWLSMPFAGRPANNSPYDASTPVTSSFSFTGTLGAFSATLPYWFCVLMVACLSFAPWFKWSKRFSLRTLLIAITLVAVVLGLVIAFT